VVSNPGKGKAAKEILEVLMAKKVPIGVDFPCLDGLRLTPKERMALTYEDVFWHAALSRACHGDLKAISEVMDRRFGKSPQHIVNENHNYSYVNFLEECAKQDKEETTLIDIEPETKTEVHGGISDEGGSSGVHSDVMSDLGLFSTPSSNGNNSGPIEEDEGDE